MISLKGKIVNFDETFNGEIIFNKKIDKIIRSKSIQNEDYIIPGFIDLHCHGANGFDTMDGWNAIKKMSAYHLSNGTTSILPTTWTSTIEHTFNALNKSKQARGTTSANDKSFN